MLLLRRAPHRLSALSVSHLVLPHAEVHTHELFAQGMSEKVEITIPQADDFHHHFRDGEVLADTVKHATRMFRRAVSG